MLPKFVIGVVLVCVLPCNSQNQKFLAVPYEEDEQQTPPSQFPQRLRNDRNLRASVTQQVNNDFIINVQQPQPVQEQFNSNLGRTLGHQDPRLSAIQQQQLQRFPSGEAFAINQPSQSSFVENQNVQHLTPTLRRNPNRRPHTDRTFPEAVVQPQQQAQEERRPINTFLSVEEPTLTLAGIAENQPAAVPVDHTRSLTNGPVNPHIIQPTAPQTIFQNIRVQNRPQPQPQIPQHTQFPVHLNIDPHAALRVQSQIRQQQQIDPQLLQQIAAANNHQIPQQAHISIPQPVQRQIVAQVTPRPTHRTHIQRPSIRNQQPRVVVPMAPLQPELLIADQPIQPSPLHRFVSQKNAGSNLRLAQSNPDLLRHQESARDYEEEIFRKQAESAKYSFASQIDDSISGNQNQREEVRDGVNVKGMYSYSDGYVKRTVFYEADDKGYRVIKEENEPLGDGPQFNPKGQANVSSYVAGNAVQYSITSEDIQDTSREVQETLPQRIRA